ncbi:hypothetical protein FRB98_000748 [Tulasnella sp. 332]|nr:hypothetical protein FRB98_000748 [Tulasnella sp. 332]
MFDSPHGALDASPSELSLLLHPTPTSQLKSNPMYESKKASSAESLISATESISSIEPFIVTESAPVDSTATLKPDIHDTAPPRKALTRSPFFCKPVYFEVERMLYSVSETLLPGLGYMASWINPRDSCTGYSEANPMKLNITRSEMDNILTVLHAKQISSLLTLTIEQWSEALYIATIWKLAAARDYIVERISTLFPDQAPIDRIALADRCGVHQWLHPAYETLCTRINPPTFEEGVERLGIKRIVALFTIREASRTQPVSQPPPSIPENLKMRCQNCCVVPVWYWEHYKHQNRLLLHPFQGI